MLAFLNKQIQTLLKTPPHLTNEEARFYLFGVIGYRFGAVVHTLFALSFWMNGQDFLAAYNAVVAVLFAIGHHVWIRQSAPIWLSITLFCIEVPFHASMATLVTGVANNFWLFGLFPVIVWLVTPDIRRIWRYVFSTTTAVAVIGVAAATLYFGPVSPLPLNWMVFFFVLNTGTVISGVGSYMAVYELVVTATETKLAREHERAEQLLSNILPAPIAERLKDNPDLIADQHPEVSILFADIVDFTETSAKLPPGELVNALNKVFSKFDDLVEKHGAEKIKTIGDAYMVVVGLPEPCENHAAVMTRLALDMIDAAEEVNRDLGIPLQIRVGINSGPVVAGVIGHKKFAYDLWGDTVNVASRMESSSSAGQILITEATRALLPDSFNIGQAETRQIKGKGEMPVYPITGSEH